MKYFFSVFLFFVEISIVFSNHSDFRDSINVTNYQINLTIKDFSAERISGNTKISFTPVFENSNTVKFDLLKFQIDSILSNSLNISNIYYDDFVIEIEFSEILKINDNYEIIIFYHGKPQKDAYWGGFYFTENYAFNMGVGMASEPPNFGRVWFPCIDNFTDKATYEYNITVEKGKTAVCSGMLIKTIENKDNTTTFSWKLSEEIPTYLSSVAVSDYSKIEFDVQGIERKIPFITYVNSGNEKKATKSFQNIENALQIFENHFGKYSWERIGFVETGFASGAMEHATNISMPYYALNGTLDYEMLIVHEFAHNWFGNLVTCETAKDMWLNEGWASYCEAIFIENMYGNEDFKEYVRENHLKVLKNAHINDGDFYAVYGIPAEITYGTTVYDKGFSTVHNLRNYLGDDVFFDVIKKYIQKYLYKTADTESLKEFINSETEINVNDFFDFYVYEEGFNYFVPRIVKYQKRGKTYSTHVIVNQKLKEADFFANSNKIELTFVNQDFDFDTREIYFSGEIGDSTYLLDFEPLLVIADINEKLMDATTDCYKIIHENGKQKFESTYFECNVKNLIDSIFVRVQSNWLKPVNNQENIVLGSQFWTLDCLLNNSEIEGMFYFTDNEFIENNNSKLSLFYRKDFTEEWQTVDCEKSAKYFKTSILKTGDYAIGYEK